MAKGNLSKTYQGKGPAAEALLENFNKHLDTTSGNPHHVMAGDVGAYPVEKVYTKDEVDEKLENKVDTQTLTAHTENLKNPHGVTAEQVGAYAKEDIDEKLENKVDTQTLTAHTENTNNPHGVTAEQVGAYAKTNVFNKAEIVNRENNLRNEWKQDDNILKNNFDTIIKVLLPKKADVEYVEEKFSEIVGGAPEALDTLKEIAEALNDSESVAAELINQISERYTKSEVNGLLSKKADVTDSDRRVYATPSSGLEIEGGIVVGIGSCRDEHIVIPEVDGSGNEVYAVADNVFGNLLDDGDFIKSITFPPSIKRFENEHGRLDSSVIYGDYCANLESVYILNPNIEWIGTTPLKLPGATKNVYFGGTRKQWSELNKGRYLIQLKDENIAAGIVPTLHYSYFLPYGNTYTKEEIDNKIGSIDTALDAILAIQESIIGGVEQ